ncbi:SAM-dependent methyltransferase [Streptomyces sp. BE147]|nr:SAM-dependent methyltransferase [Streptomyces sp. BE147]
MNWSHLPSVARVMDHLTGGSDHYQADRDLAAALLEAAPWLPHEWAANRRHGTRAVRAIASRYGIRRFLDLGCGLPFSRKGDDEQAPLHTYEAAASVHGDACVVYVDNDPMVAGHARMVLAEQHPFTAAVEADARQFDGLVATPEVQALLAPGRPVAVLAHDLLSWVSDRAARDLVTRLARRLPAGSVLSVTHAGLDLAPEAMEALADRYAAAGIDFFPRSRQGIQSLLALWELESPGLVPTGQWHPAPHIPGPTGNGFSYAAIAYRPEVS